MLSLKSDFDTARDWHVTAWQSGDKDSDTGDVPARLCFWISSAEQEKDCTSIISTHATGGVTYPYQTVRALKVVHPDAGSPSTALLEFDARYSGGGSGTLDQISFWRYDPQTDKFEVALLMTLSEQGEYRLFNQGSLEGLLVTADASVQSGETHFAPHRFYMEAYRYERKTGFVKVLGYLTSSKYPSFDDAEKIDVISHEVAKIKGLLREAGSRAGLDSNH